MEIKKIVVPVDFGKNTDKLVDYAMYFAKQLPADVSFCHVIEPFMTGDMMVGSPSLGNIENARRSEAEGRMANLVEDNKANNSSCKGEVLLGDIVDKIIGYAKDEYANLIIIGTHGTKGLERILLGSVAERVVKRSACPCLVMNPYK